MTGGGTVRSYRPAPPEHGDLVDWPAWFGRRFLLTVDTEETFDWSAPFARDGWNVEAAAALPAANRRFADRGVPATYLVDHAIAATASSVDAVRAVLAAGNATLGAQLHPWINPPFEERLSVANSFTGNLPVALQAAKLERLTDALVAAFGKRPIVYRAGRYGLGPDTAALLYQAGYRIDCSVRARYRYDREAGPDFSAVGNRAYRTGPDAAILSVPFTTVYTGAARRLGAGLHPLLSRIPHGIGAAARLGLLNRVSLTPEGMPFAEAAEAVRVAVGEGERLLTFAFHSPSVVPGHTPYVRDAGGLARFWDWWDRMFDLLDGLGVMGTDPATILAAADTAAAGDDTLVGPAGLEPAT